MDVPEMLGETRITPVVKSDAYNVQLADPQLGAKCLKTVLNRYMERAARTKRRKELDTLIASKKAELKVLEDELELLDVKPTLGNRVRLDSLMDEMRPAHRHNG